MATAGSPVATSTVCSARGTVEMGFIAARTRSTSPLVMPPSMPPARSVRRESRCPSTSIPSWATPPRARGGPRAGGAGGLQAVPALHGLHRLDAHQRAGQPGVQPPVPVHRAAQARGQAVDDDLDDAAEGVAGPAGGGAPRRA